MHQIIDTRERIIKSGSLQQTRYTKKTMVYGLFLVHLLLFSVCGAVQPLYARAGLSSMSELLYQNCIDFYFILFFLWWSRSHLPFSKQEGSKVSDAIVLSWFCVQVCIALMNYDWLHLKACMHTYDCACMDNACVSFAEPKRSTAVEMVFSGALFQSLLLFQESYYVGLKNVLRKHLCRHKCSKYLFTEGFWDRWSAEHL